MRLALNHALEIDVKRMGLFSQNSGKILRHEEEILSDTRRVLFMDSEEEDADGIEDQTNHSFQNTRVAGIVASESPSAEPNTPKAKSHIDEAKSTEKVADKDWWRSQVKPALRADISDAKYQLALSLTVSMKTLFAMLPATR